MFLARGPVLCITGVHTPTQKSSTGRFRPRTSRRTTINNIEQGQSPSARAARPITVETRLSVAPAKPAVPTRSADAALARRQGGHDRIVLRPFAHHPCCSTCDSSSDSSAMYTSQPRQRVPRHPQREESAAPATVPVVPAQVFTLQAPALYFKASSAAPCGITALVIALPCGRGGCAKCSKYCPSQCYHPPADMMIPQQNTPSGD